MYGRSGSVSVPGPLTVIALLIASPAWGGAWTDDLALLLATRTLSESCRRQGPVA